ncbi:MAG: tetratricopeptide repeat protein [Bdellovibrionales bacterium]
MSQILRQLKQLQKDVKDSPRPQLRLVPQWEKLSGLNNQSIKLWAGRLLAIGVLISLTGFAGLKTYDFFTSTPVQESEKVLTLDEKLQQDNQTAMSAYEQKNFVTAQKIWKQLHDQFPDRTEIAVNLAMSERALGRYKSAQQYLEKSLETDPKNSLALSNLGLVLTDLKKFKEAEKVLIESVQLDTMNADAVFNLATLYELEGDWVKANKAYSRYVSHTGAKEHLVKTINDRSRRVRSWATLQYNEEVKSE